MHCKNGPEMIYLTKTFPPSIIKCYFCSGVFEKKTQLTEHKKKYKDGDYWTCPKPNCKTSTKIQVTVHALLCCEVI